MEPCLLHPTRMNVSLFCTLYSLCWDTFHILPVSDLTHYIRICFKYCNILGGTLNVVYTQQTCNCTCWFCREKLHPEKELLFFFSPREVKFGQAGCIPKHSGAKTSDIAKYLTEDRWLDFIFYRKRLTVHALTTIKRSNWHHGAKIL